MCEANAYLIQGEEKKLIMEAVDTVEPEDGGLRLTSIFGDQKFLKARIHSLIVSSSMAVSKSIFSLNRDGLTIQHPGRTISFGSA